MTNSNKILAVVRPNRPKPDDIKHSEAKTDSKTVSNPESQTESTSPEQSSDSQSLSKPSTLDKPSRRPRPFSSSDKPSRPSRPRPKVLEEVLQATNSVGETFNPGDQIWVRSPWGKWAVAEIDKFYQCSPDEIVAHFFPKEEREGWTWMGGCIRSQLLKKVPTPQA